MAEGAAVPGGVPEGVTILQQPLDEIYLVASAAMDSFAQLDAVDSIRFSGRKLSESLLLVYVMVLLFLRLRGN